MKRIIFLSLVLFSVFLSCSKEAVDSDGNANLSVMIIDVALVPESEGSIKDNRWTRLINEKMLKHDINVEFKPKGGNLVAHTIMMATGSAPDVAFTHNRLLFSKYAIDGGLTDLGPYLDEYGPNIKKILGEEFLANGMIDDIQYAIPSRPDDNIGKRYISHIRKDWLDKLGLEVPTNREELVSVLKAFKEQDPGGIGSENVIPWGLVPPDPGTVFEPDFWLFDAMYSFMDHDLEKNISHTWPKREGLKEYLKWMHDLYQNGLIDREFATLSEDDKKRKIVNGQVGFFHWEYDRFYRQDSSSPLFVLEQMNSDIEFIPIEVFQNDEGNYPKIQPKAANYYIFVPKKSKNPAAAVSYLNWLLDEETQNWMNYGLEGEHYEMVDGRRSVSDLDYNFKTFQYLRQWIRIMGPFPENSDNYDYYEDQSKLVDFDGRDAKAFEITSRDLYPAPLYTEEMFMMAKHGSGLIKICEKYWVKILTEDDFETNYNEFQQKLADRNIDLIDQERTEYFERH